MKKPFLPSVGSKNCILCALAVFLTICGGCSGGSSNGSAELKTPEIIVEPNQTLFTAPHGFDIYRATNADKAIVFLHSGGGSKHGFAYLLGFKGSPDDSNYDLVNEQILLDNRAIAVFPQGQAIDAAPNSQTWNNYVMDSGQDDMQFLRDLVSFISTQYDVSTFYIVGHSMGGVMVNRIWCEVPDLFEAYISIAGPASEHFLTPETSCSPIQVKPYLGIVGTDDNVLQNDDDWEAQTWTINPLIGSGPAFVDPILIGERYFLPTRVTQRCGETVEAGDADAITDGEVTTWSFCNNSIKLMRVEFAGHSLKSLESVSGYDMLEFVFDFINLIAEDGQETRSP